MTPLVSRVGATAMGPRFGVGQADGAGLHKELVIGALVYTLIVGVLLWMGLWGSALSRSSGLLVLNDGSASDGRTQEGSARRTRRCSRRDTRRSGGRKPGSRQHHGEAAEGVHYSRGPNSRGATEKARTGWSASFVVSRTKTSVRSPCCSARVSRSRSRPRATRASRLRTDRSRK